jgi:hypothetical protein
VSSIGYKYLPTPKLIERRSAMAHDLFRTATTTVASARPALLGTLAAFSA